MTDQPIPPADEQVLEPCPNPWCEAGEREGDFSPAVRILSFGNYAVQCTSCQMAGPVRRSEKEATAAWNQRTRPSPVVDGPWSYAINYGPEGEANYANVYDGNGQLVGNLRTHHAIAVVTALAMRPAPDAVLREALNTAYAWAIDDMVRHPRETELHHQRRAIIRRALASPASTAEGEASSKPTGREGGSAVKVEREYKLGDRVTKNKGSSWTGKIVGFYSTELTPAGYAVESENEPGSVQIYPAAALASPASTAEGEAK